MDLLGGYDSDADGDASDNEQQPPQNAGRAILTAPGPSPANNEENGPPHTAGLSRRGLFAALPPPKAKADGTPGGEGRGR